ncbi:response regulator [Tenacibaculum sp. SG-28]|uniref:response regulator n=1 Tax=Tenacibaculum sp. SG-28 TaxID=754426 RepID=UPI000CF57EB6|nr:response regulator [Tenacibaculum sp. SG-28]
MDKLRLLLLEDSDAEANKLIAFLEANDYEIIRVKNIFDAEKEIRKRYFDVVILDIIINGKPDGIEFAKK